LDVAGSLEYVLTWKTWDMPSGPPICALRARARPTSGNVFGGSPIDPLTGWPTAQARDHFPAHSPEYIAEKKAQGHGMANLNDVTQLAGWPTPMAGSPGTEDYNPAGNTDSSRKTVDLVGWRSPTKGNGDRGGQHPDQRKGHMLNLQDEVLLTGWATPVGRDCGGTPEQFLARKEKAVARGVQMGVALTSLSLQAQLTGWATPGAGDDRSPSRGWQAARDRHAANGVNKQMGLRDQAVHLISGWATPTTRDHKDGATDLEKAGVPINGLLGRQVSTAGWATPNASDEKWRYSNNEMAEKRAASGKQMSLEAQAHLISGSTTPSSPAPTERRGALNPYFSLWLMGYPKAWLTCLPSKASRSRKRSRGA
jgi:hypothetical protein